MAYKKHPRHITQEQFADNTTVDGDRLDSAMESFERHVNAVPQGDVETKWLPTRFVAGWIPSKDGAPNQNFAHHWPWLTTPNISNWVMAGSTVPDQFSNPERVKGYGIPGINPATGTSPTMGTARNSSQYIWTTSFHVHRPTIITNVDVMLHTDQIGSPTRQYANGFLYGNPPPQGYANGDASEDFSFSLHVDAPTSTENRQLNEVELIRSQFVVNQSTATYKAWGFPHVDMTPAAFPGGPPHGVWEPVACNVPIHQNARVRLSLVIPPAITVAASAYNSSWGNYPWSRQHFTTVVHMLEEVS